MRRWWTIGREMLKAEVEASEIKRGCTLQIPQFSPMALSVSRN